jgi:hypothetical protein
VLAGGVVLVGVISPFMSLLLLFSWVSVLVVVEDTGCFEDTCGCGFELVDEEGGTLEGEEEEVFAEGEEAEGVAEEEVGVVAATDIEEGTVATAEFEEEEEVVVAVVFCASELFTLLFFDVVCTVLLFLLLC